MPACQTGRIPDSGGWRVHGGTVEKGAFFAAFLQRAIAAFAEHGIARIEWLKRRRNACHRRTRGERQRGRLLRRRRRVGSDSGRCPQRPPRHRAYHG
jgi:hypothetical protein